MTADTDLTFENEQWVDRTIPEDTAVLARLDSIKKHSFTWKDQKDRDPATGQPKEKTSETLEWWWTVVDQRDDGLYYERQVKGECKPEMNSNPRNRLNRWYCGLMGIEELPIGQRVNLQEVIGLKALITVTHKPDKNDPAMKWERVDEVIPANLGASDEPPF